MVIIHNNNNGYYYSIITINEFDKYKCKIILNKIYIITKHKLFNCTNKKYCSGNEGKQKLPLLGMAMYQS